MSHDRSSLDVSDPFRRQARLLTLVHEARRVEQLNQLIHETIRRESKHLTEPNFRRIGVDDLAMLFDQYDLLFFGGFLRAMLQADAAPLSFRLSKRMTRVAGTTTMFPRTPRARGKPIVAARYEIAISTTLLFGTFTGPGREVTIGNLVCRDRLEALQRTFEHELLHLAEFLAWGKSSCSAANFHQLSRRIFAHEGVHHDLVTPRERAAVEHGIQVGDLVSFEYEGVRRTGRVNRITKRATVLVDDPRGRLFTDGKTYATFYVPIPWLRKEAR